MDHRRNNAREQTENQDTAMVSHMFVQQKLQNKEILEKLRSVSPDLTIPHSEKTRGVRFNVASSLLGYLDQRHS